MVYGASLLSWYEREGIESSNLSAKVVNVTLKFDNYVDKSKNVKILEKYGIMCLVINVGQ